MLFTSEYNVCQRQLSLNVESIPCLLNGLIFSASRHIGDFNGLIISTKQTALIPVLCYRPIRINNLGSEKKIFLESGRRVSIINDHTSLYYCMPSSKSNYFIHATRVARIYTSYLTTDTIRYNFMFPVKLKDKLFPINLSQPRHPTPNFTGT